MSRTDTAAIVLCIAYAMSGIGIAALYAMPGTEIGYAATRRQETSRKAHVMHPLQARLLFDVRYFDRVLCNVICNIRCWGEGSCCAMSFAEMGFDAMRCPVACYVFAMRCPVLRCTMLLGGTATAFSNGPRLYTRQVASLDR
eukprot:3401358-Rhodomonas_salina.1